MLAGILIIFRPLQEDQRLSGQLGLGSGLRFVREMNNNDENYLPTVKLVMLCETRTGPQHISQLPEILFNIRKISFSILCHPFSMN